MSLFQPSPRIYNLFPRIVGRVSFWEVELPRIKKMAFNWVYLNPINEVGHSGSLYSIKDYFKLSSDFALDKEDQITWNSFRSFVDKAHSRNMKIMVDLVINHTAIDMVPNHPDWYAKKWAIISKKTGNPVYYFENDSTKEEDPEETPPIFDFDKYPPQNFRLEYRIANPYAKDPRNIENITIWGDLAEINYNSPCINEIMEYWQRLLTFFIELGVDGFRCDAAYQVSPNIWKELIDFSHSKNSAVVFWAETLGGNINTYGKLGEAGFNYIASSSKYWDFTQPWCVSQYNQFRYASDSISFPESHDTERLAMQTKGRRDIQVFRYFFAAFFSAGVMIPIGYEFGYQKRLHVVNTDPEDKEIPQFDIMPEISQINLLKMSYQSLNEDGLITHYAHSNPNCLILRKDSRSGQETLLLLYNKNWNSSITLKNFMLEEYLSPKTKIFEIYFTGNKQLYQNHELILLQPNGYRLFFQKRQ